MHLEAKVRGLVAVSASIGADCKPCLQSSIALALHVGASEDEIRAAIAIGRTVRRCAAGMQELANGSDSVGSSLQTALAAGCAARRTTEPEGTRQ
jgi:AhpD family alkylhydroperoxidase